MEVSLSIFLSSSFLQKDRNLSKSGHQILYESYRPSSQWLDNACLLFGEDRFLNVFYAIMDKCMQQLFMKHLFNLGPIFGSCDKFIVQRRGRVNFCL